MSFIAVNVRIDMRQMDAALALAQRFSSRAPEVVINSTAFHVVKRTIELTPAVPINRMDYELGVMVSMPQKLRGNGLKTGKKSMRYQGDAIIPYRRGGKVNMVPLSVLIIHASVLGVRSNQARQPGMKRYNRLTNMRYARTYSPFAGKTRAVGAAAMRDAEHRLIAARHSSSGFIAAGWHAVLSQLRARFRGGAPPVDGGMATAAPLKQFKHFGEIRVAGSSTGYTLEIANLIGTRPGSRGDNSANLNEALHRHSGPALQQAINDEAESKMAHYWTKLLKEDLEPQWNAVR